MCDCVTTTTAKKSKSISTVEQPWNDWVNTGAADGNWSVYIAISEIALEKTCNATTIHINRHGLLWW